MKRSYVFFYIILGICCFAAGKASISHARPLNPKIMKGVLYMTANLDESEPVQEPAADIPAAAAQEPVPIQKPVFERTITTAPLTSEGLYISNLAKAQVDIDELLSLPPETAGADVLILHTHGCEAYTPTEKDSYASTGDFRTTDTNYNVVRIGDEIQKTLEGFGIKVTHDKTLCDWPDYNSSYDNSLAIAKKYAAQNPNLKVILDVHRDSIAGSSGEQIKTVGAENTSQLMFVVGTDMTGLEHPLWRQNLSFALNLQKRIISKYPNLMRPINLRTHRFNQQVSTGSLILEVGSDGNTLDEALNAARIFGRELGGYLTGA